MFAACFHKTKASVVKNTVSTSAKAVRYLKSIAGFLKSIVGLAKSIANSAKSVFSFSKSVVCQCPKFWQLNILVLIVSWQWRVVSVCEGYLYFTIHYSPFTILVRHITLNITLASPFKLLLQRSKT